MSTSAFLLMLADRSERWSSSCSSNLLGWSSHSTASQSCVLSPTWCFCQWGVSESSWWYWCSSGSGHRFWLGYSYRINGDQNGWVQWHLSAQTLFLCLLSLSSLNRDYVFYSRFCWFLLMLEPTEGINSLLLMFWLLCCIFDYALHYYEILYIANFCFMLEPTEGIKFTTSNVLASMLHFQLCFTLLRDTLHLHYYEILYICMCYEYLPAWLYWRLW